MKNWIDNVDENNELVLSSRIRLARNLKLKPFPHKLSEEQSEEVIKEVENAFYASSHTKDQFKSIYLNNIGNNQARGYFEKHLISPQLINTKDKSAFIVNKDETISLMINEEDHIRLQCITSGFNVKEAYDVANKIDDMMEENLTYAFDEKLGYKTACPTNLGTGLRVSAMLHLPALTMNDEINGIFKALTQVGMTIRGLYGEGSKVEGNIYQVSNQITLGVNEGDIINNIEAVVAQLTSQEYRAREQFINKYKYELEDKIYRSLGILRTAVILSSKECLDLLSNVRMGIEMGLIKDMDRGFFNKLLIDTQPYSLQLNIGRELDAKERDIERATLVRNYINK